MKTYCLVKNGSIVGTPKVLPTTFENVSNFHLLDDESLKSYGWLPYEIVSENKEVIIGTELEILEDKVIEKILTRDKTEEEKKADLNNKKIQEWVVIRNKRNELLAESDKDIVNDKWLFMDEETKNIYINYRKKLRNIPQDFENPFEVEFPELPQIKNV